jgi:hypothetical protein
VPKPCARGSGGDDHPTLVYSAWLPQILEPSPISVVSMLVYRTFNLHLRQSLHCVVTNSQTQLCTRDLQEARGRAEAKEREREAELRGVESSLRQAREELTLAKSERDDAIAAEARLRSVREPHPCYLIV